MTYLCACPIPDTTPLVNNPPYLIHENIVPEPNAVIELTCTDQLNEDFVTFSIENAVRDQDVDDDASTMFYVWYINTPTAAGGPGSETIIQRELPETTVGCEDVLVQGTAVLTVYALDRFPASQATDESTRIPGEGGFAVTATWVIEVIR